MSLFKKIALVGAFSAVMFLGLAVGTASADDDDDHDWHHHVVDCYDDAGNFMYGTCQLLWTGPGRGWVVFPNQTFYNPYYLYNPYYGFSGLSYIYGYPYYFGYQYGLVQTNNFGYPLYNQYYWPY